jgi:TatD DNase family protein
VAVGEAGLDYHYDWSPREAQRVAFAAQLALGARHGRPVVVHSRDADQDMAAMLRETRATVVLHSFSSGPAVFEAGLEIGAYFSWSGMVTFRNWALADRLLACPPDRLLLETDSPYLAPVPHRGRRNEPAFLREVAARVAAVRDVPPDDVARTTTANAVRVFGSRLRDPSPSSGD